MNEEIKSAKKKLKDKYDFSFPVIMVGGSGASLHRREIWVGLENPLDTIEPMIIHEAYHKIFKIDQVESFKEMDKGNPLPYFEEEMWIWNKIKEDFPELSSNVDKIILAQKKTLGITN